MKLLKWGLRCGWCYVLFEFDVIENDDDVVG